MLLLSLVLIVAVDACVRCRLSCILGHLLGFLQSLSTPVTTCMRDTSTEHCKTFYPADKRSQPRLRVYSILLLGYFHAAATENDVTPRLTFSYNAKERTTRSFSVNGVFNFTSVLLSSEDNILYVGARESVFALNLSDISEVRLQRNLTWKTPERKRDECSFKGKDLQTDCFNYIKILLRMNSTHLYACGTYAFSPICAYISTADFSFVKSDTGGIVTEDGRSRCPFNPEYKSTAIMAGWFHCQMLTVV
ncbi:unnamed protein product [Menidia menidia]|uniref:(Atlantic silverside) hypothetical protein n=1 Tax=Menidia menidia TaxID=238744 RepID=A0A8S4BH09_9TELE|nr:unnamed protein product [Menidia menidia]